VPTAYVVKSAPALFVRNDASKQRVVGTNAKDVKVAKVVKRGENKDMTSARRGGGRGPGIELRVPGGGIEIGR
jgi:hypothetical protein